MRTSPLVVLPLLMLTTLFSTPQICAQSPETIIYDHSAASIRQANQRIIRKALLLRDQVDALSKDEMEKQLRNPVPVPLSLPPARSQAMSVEDLADHARMANLRVGYCYKCKHCEDWHLNLAGGYAIAPNVIATCDHVIATKTNMRDGFLVTVDHEENVACGVAILARSSAMDAVLVKVKGAEFIPVSLNGDVRQGAASYCFSHPLKQQGYFSAGIINRFLWGEKYNGEAQDSLDGLRHLRVNFSTEWAPGSSGSPLFDHAGNVIAHVSMIAGLSQGKDKPTLLMVRTGIPARSVQMLAECMDSPTEIQRIATLDDKAPETTGSAEKSGRAADKPSPADENPET